MGLAALRFRIIHPYRNRPEICLNERRIHCARQYGARMPYGALRIASARVIRFTADFEA